MKFLMSNHNRVSLLTTAALGITVLIWQLIVIPELKAESTNKLQCNAMATEICLHLSQGGHALDSTSASLISQTSAACQAALKTVFTEQTPTEFMTCTSYVLQQSALNSLQ